MRPLNEFPASTPRALSDPDSPFRTIYSKGGYGFHSRSKTTVLHLRTAFPLRVARRGTVVIRCMALASVFHSDFPVMVGNVCLSYILSDVSDFRGFTLISKLNLKQEQLRISERYA